jgi:hypothetical protein
VGAGRGGSTGLDPPSNVELAEKAGDPGGSVIADPSSALPAAGGDDCEDVVYLLWRVITGVCFTKKRLLTTMSPAQAINKSPVTESLITQPIQHSRGFRMDFQYYRIKLTRGEGKDAQPELNDCNGIKQ